MRRGVRPPIVAAGGVAADGVAVSGRDDRGAGADGGVTAPDTVGAIGSDASPAVLGVSAVESAGSDAPGPGPTVPAAGRGVGAGPAVRCKNGGAGGGAVRSDRAGAGVTGPATEGSSGGRSSHAGGIAMVGGGANER